MILKKSKKYTRKNGNKSRISKKVKMYKNKSLKKTMKGGSGPYADVNTGPQPITSMYQPQIATTTDPKGVTYDQYGNLMTTGPNIMKMTGEQISRLLRGPQSPVVRRTYYTSSPRYESQEAQNAREAREAGETRQQRLLRLRRVLNASPGAFSRLNTPQDQEKRNRFMNEFKRQKQEVEQRLANRKGRGQNPTIAVNPGFNRHSLTRKKAGPSGYAPRYRGRK